VGTPLSNLLQTTRELINERTYIYRTKYNSFNGHYIIIGTYVIMSRRSMCKKHNRILSLYLLSKRIHLYTTYLHGYVGTYNISTCNIYLNSLSTCFVVKCRHTYIAVGHKFKGSVTLTSNTGSASVIQKMSYSHIILYNTRTTYRPNIFFNPGLHTCIGECVPFKSAPSHRTLYCGVMQAHMGLSLADVTIKMDLPEQRVTGPLLIYRFMTSEYIAIVCAV